MLAETEWQQLREVGFIAHLKKLFAIMDENERTDEFDPQDVALLCIQFGFLLAIIITFRIYGKTAKKKTRRNPEENPFRFSVKSALLVMAIGSGIAASIFQFIRPLLEPFTPEVILTNIAIVLILLTTAAQFLTFLIICAHLDTYNWKRKTEEEYLEEDEPLIPVGFFDEVEVVKDEAAEVNASTDNGTESKPEEEIDSVLAIGFFEEENNVGKVIAIIDSGSQIDAIAENNALPSVGFIDKEDEEEKKAEEGIAIGGKIEDGDNDDNERIIPEGFFGEENQVGGVIENVNEIAAHEEEEEGPMVIPADFQRNILIFGPEIDAANFGDLDEECTWIEFIRGG